MSTTRVPRTSTTRRARRGALVLGAAALALTGLTAPASAADTLVTFTVNPGGALTMSVPSSATLSSTAAGSSTSAQLGAVTVHDGRNDKASWIASVSATDAVATDGSGSTVPKARIQYTTGTPTKQGAAVVVPGATVPTALGVVLPVITTTISSGSTVSWTPTLSVSVPAGTPAGTYAMTVTHSVS